MAQAEDDENLKSRTVSEEFSIASLPLTLCSELKLWHPTGLRVRTSDFALLTVAGLCMN